ncbi:MAG: aspartyl/glutamyl-tRNA amidotransferase subunit A [Verrucomicrobia bacterium 21-51-4]|nr:MAG: aspartyl/glutamyl-tRNA amidotransferase subunit A [Verrucomicrobia bacterium 21-51-4]HQU08873.1 Asp-tRNA(Asn)/Glu-tRNA(Gln) amidotransferase subunit GatA [Opitutales bacterium]
MHALHDLTAMELSELLANRTISSVELTQAVIARTRALEPKLDAYLSFNDAEALAQAAESDKRRAAGQSCGILDGIPITLKDVIAAKDQPLTCASRMLENFVSPYDATVTRRLREAGLVLWGRANMDEFAMGSSTENSAFKTSKNPWDTACVPGGSSGGSTAAVAGHQVPLALGSETGGSIRQPASFCGIVGLKTTYGRVSRYGLVAFASSLDQIGPVTTTVEDAAALMEVIAGHDPMDSTTLNAPVPHYRELLKQKRNWTLGIPKEYFADGLDPEVRAAVENAIKFYESQGAKIKEVSLPHSDMGLPVYYIIAPAEAASNLSRYEGVRYGHRAQNIQDTFDLYARSRAEGFGAEVKRRIILGTYVLNSGYYDAYYVRAQKMRTLIRQDFTSLFDQGVDAIVTPTTPSVAFKAGDKTTDPLSMYLSDVYTVTANLAGIPGISVPCGFSKSGMPIGLQLLGKPLGEADLLTLAYQFEQAHDFHKKRPSLNA